MGILIGEKWYYNNESHLILDKELNHKTALSRKKNL